MEKIYEGRRLLERSPKLRYEERVYTTKVKRKVKRKGRTKTITRVIKHVYLYRQQVALAVLDRTNCSVLERRFWLTAEEVAEANQMRLRYQDAPYPLPNFRPVDPRENLEIVVNWWNTFNSDLSINNRGQDNSYRYAVVGNKYLIPNSRLAYASDKKGKKYSDVIYVPYSRAIHEKPVIDSGKQFLNKKVAVAFKELKESGVESRAYPGFLVTDTITENFIKHIFINEHSDPRWMLSASDNGLWVAERYLVLLGANGDRTGRFTYSKTGALGIAQIMPETYAHVVATYPDARLNKDIDVGRADIQNAVKASILVFDDHLAKVKDTIDNAPPQNRDRYQELFDAKSEEEIDELRAAIYNGGPGKYVPATGSISDRVQETVDFVRKFKLIREMHLFEENYELPREYPGDSASQDKRIPPAP